MVNLGGCVQVVRRGRKRGLDIPASHGEDREAKRVRFTENRGQKRQSEDDECNRRPLNSYGGVMRLIPQGRIQQRTVEQRVVVLVLQVVKEMVKVDQIIPGAYGAGVSVATQPSTNDQDDSEDRKFFYSCSP